MISRREMMNDKIVEENGNPLLLKKCKGSRFTSLILHGKSTQGSTTGAQLFDKSKAFAGWVNSDGSINNAGTVGKGDNIVSEYIPFEAGKQYFCGSDFVWIYNTEKGFVKKADTELKGGVFTSPDNAGFFVVAFSVSAEKALAKSNEIMINVGSVKKPYEPYTGGAPSPSPSYLQEIESAGQSGEISAKVGRTEMDKNPQVVIIPTPGGLPGIPVSSGGNYTDKDGQQWVCDEIDFGRGAYVQRVGIEMLTSLNVNEITDTPGRFYSDILKNEYASGTEKSLSNRACWNIWGLPQENKWVFGISSTSIYISPPKSSGYTADAINAYLAEQITESSPLIIYAQLITPIENDLTAETIAAYKKLHTYSPTTTVINDAGAGMSVGYRKVRG